MVLVTRHGPSKVVEILLGEIDPPPSLLRSLLTMNVRNFVGGSTVCGRITESGFDLRNRRGPALSLRARGTLAASHDGSTEITLSFSTPAIPDLLGVLVFGRYRRDRHAITSFLETRLGAVEREASS